MCIEKSKKRKKEQKNKYIYAYTTTKTPHLHILIFYTFYSSFNKTMFHISNSYLVVPFINFDLIT
jgi:hypothetical protein